MLTFTALLLCLVGCALGTALKPSTPKMLDTDSWLANHASQMENGTLEIRDTGLRMEDKAAVRKRRAVTDSERKITDTPVIPITEEPGFLITDKHGIPITDKSVIQMTDKPGVPMTDNPGIPITDSRPVYSTVGSGVNGISVNLPNDPHCNMTLDGYTWQCDNCTLIPDVIDHSTCAEMCLEKPWCVGWTWELSDTAASICYLFEELVNQHECSDCSNCTSGMFDQFSGVCSTSNPNDIVGIESASSELHCAEYCSVTADCNYYSWSEADLFYHLCFMFKECKETKTCEPFQSGQLECFNPELPDQCEKYLKLDDKTRSVNHYGEPYYCDQSGQDHCESPDWKGDGWYRMIVGGKIPEYSPGINHCGTHAPGWLNGSHPTIIGSTTSGTVCYDWSGDECNWENDIKITNCGGYYVYYLRDCPTRRLRYCAS